MNSNTENICHFYRRCAFGLSPKHWSIAQKSSLNQVVDFYFNDIEKSMQQNEADLSKINDSIKDYTMSQKELRAMMKEDKELLHAPTINWLKQMSNENQNHVLERITLFWHGHFACQTLLPHLKSRQLYTLRKYALGSFRDMVKAISRDASMLRFLNNQQNRKGHPNENFARELLELFTIGKGNYTEEDIKEAARAFTGWQSNMKGEFKFNEKQHDDLPKTFFGKTGNFGGDDIINCILDKKETAYFITKKIWIHFVSEDLNLDLIKELAEDYYSSDYDNMKLFRTMFSSTWFYDPKYRGKRIKSPVELIAGIMKTMDVNFKDTVGLLFLQKALGQVLFFPPNVAGWNEGKSWVNSSTLNFRLNLVNALLQKEDLDIHTKDEFESLDRSAAFRKFNVDVNIESMTTYFQNFDNEKIFEEMKMLLLPVPIENDFTFFHPFILKQNKNEFIKSLMLRLMSMPQYQLC